MTQQPATEAAPPLLHLSGLHKSFGTNEILRGIDLEVHAGETVAIIGPSGTGKSTLLRCVNWLEKPTAGEVTLDGVRLHAEMTGKEEQQAMRALRSRVGMVFQQYNLWPHFSVLRNVTEGQVRVLGTDPSEAKAKARELLARVRMEAFEDRYPSQLSGGQQQRVAIARTLAMGPRLVLFDEVTSALDPELVGEVLETMKQLADDGLTMLVVTHEMGFARRVADRVVFMDGGHIAEQGPAGVVFENPVNERTRAFFDHVRRSSWTV
ncbi:amino acid ABC transporter ATP-binding protein [Amycolatopsis sp. NPDC023774]|uniref:amino acid ABC transporter ATP-binding protein n=1 Tax=Amycolatopsis sp. NPDC023774 TaxID=3155015 RepID=UPI0033C79E98